MSRIGRQKIKIPPKVTVEVKNSGVRVSGPKGDLFRGLPNHVAVAVADGVVKVSVRNPEEKDERSLWGTFAAHIKNMVAGVTDGFKKELEISGVGFRASAQGKDLKLEVGYSHPVVYKMPDGISVSVEKNVIRLESPDKELLGRVAAEIRNVRKPEPYKGKGIRYIDEVVRRKAGKTAKGTTAS